MADASEIIEHTDQLVQYLAAGEKPRANWRIGTEHEKFVFTTDTCQRAGYSGASGIGELLRRAQTSDSEPIIEGENIIGLKLSNGGSITLEPGGQLELSGAPLASIHDTCAEINQHLEHLRPICHDLRLTLIGTGFDPISKREDVQWMPKDRYKIMREYMPTRGSMGLDMMLRTCTVQVNLDYCSEQDMREKMYISAALQPLATALFAASPLKELQPSGMVSTRASCWRDTDPDRTGMPSFLFEDNFGYEHWVNYILNVPMYFLYDHGTYLNVAGANFRDLIAGKLKGFEGRRATMKDWEDHLTVAFPEVRLKQFIETRGADAGRWDDLYALPALWVGLLYDADAQAEALQIAQTCNAQEIQQLTYDAAELGLQAQLKGRPLQEWGQDVMRIAEGGLKRRQMLNCSGEDETQYLQPLQHILATKQTSAEKLLNDFNAAKSSSLLAPEGNIKPCNWLINRLRN